MHIPDGFLDTKTVLASALLASVGVGAAVSRARKTLPPSKIPVLGLSAALLFASQMVNFPVAGGTSGHIVGSVLAAVILGPSGAVIALMAVLLVQALLFADGGLLALGANVLNMAVVGSLLGYAVYRGGCLILKGERGILAAAGFASWCSTVCAAAMCSGELAWSGMAPWSVIFPAMVGVHALIGLGEGIITMLVLSALLRVRPDLVHHEQENLPGGTWTKVIFAGTAALAVLLFIAPFASPWPDGLESVAARIGFASHSLPQPILPAAFAGYHIGGIVSPGVATIIAGAIGAFVVLMLSVLLARILLSRGNSAR